MPNDEFDPIALFSMYMRVTGVPTIGNPIRHQTLPGQRPADPTLEGKRLGVINGSSWIGLWTNYYCSMLLPNVQLVSVGNEAIQLNFMKAHAAGATGPPPVNVELFAQYATDLIELHGVDAILISCSTMNRSVDTVKKAVEPHGVPVIQIDEAMMEEAVAIGGTTLVVATHGPTVLSTQALLSETAQRMNSPLDFAGETVEEAFDQLGRGDIEGHNQTIAGAIRRGCKDRRCGSVVLAQLSMTVFNLSYPDPIKSFGVPVLTSGILGFDRAGTVLRNQADA